MADRLRTFTREELAVRRERGESLLAIDNVVYDVTHFLEEHPGGAEVLLRSAGGDASACFHAVGHSDTALTLRQTFSVGEMSPEDKWEPVARDTLNVQPDEPLTVSAIINVWGTPVVLAALAALIYTYLLP